MRIFSVLVFKWVNSDTRPILLHATYEVSHLGIFQRGSAREIALFVSREVLQRSKPGDRHSVLHSEHMCHACIKPDRLCVAVITDEEYPQRVAFGLVNTVFEEFLNVHPSSVWGQQQKDTDLKVPAIEGVIQKYQDPSEADKIMKIQKDLDETKDILIKSIDQLLERGEKLDSLAQKSQDLSFQSKVFMEKSQDLNKCCIIL